MIRVYVAGPLRIGILAANSQKATDVAYRVAKLGYAPFVPHLSCDFDGNDYAPYADASRGFTLEFAVGQKIWETAKYQSNETPIFPKAENRLNDDEWIAIDLAWVEAAVRIRGESVGADAEVAEAARLHLPVFEVDGPDDVDDVHKWMQHWQEVQL